MDEMADHARLAAPYCSGLIKKDSSRSNISQPGKRCRRRDGATKTVSKKHRRTYGGAFLERVLPSQEKGKADLSIRPGTAQSNRDLPCFHHHMLRHVVFRFYFPGSRQMSDVGSLDQNGLGLHAGRIHVIGQSVQFVNKRGCPSVNTFPVASLTDII
ncbi:hypothetical protein VTK73DRAFT_5765 [Phialemonium thermophilum]|uniref:Uncharacterized protein n=1 Tax=Phialemonium thermophilum TaxID=223376 RepID=A0ABR3WMC5_9PEZI